METEDVGINSARDPSHVVAMAAGSAWSYATPMNVTDHLSGHGKALRSGFLPLTVVILMPASVITAQWESTPEAHR